MIGCRLAAGLLAACGVLAGCATHGERMAAVERELAAGDTGGALERLEAQDIAPGNGGLHALHEGMIRRMHGDLDGSIAAFERAIDTLGALEAISVSETAASLVVNEGVKSYAGDVYERVLVHVFQALNYLERGDLSGARVEARRIDLGLRRIDDADARAPHGSDAFARYLAGLIYEAVGEPDNARIAHRRAWLAYRDGAAVAPPPHLGQRLARLAAETGAAPEVAGLPAVVRASAAERGWGEVFVVVCDGLVPARVSRSVWIQSRPNGAVYRVSVPALRARGRTATGIRARAGGHVAEAQRVADIAAVARATLADEIATLTARSVGRNVVRHQITRRVRDEEPVLAALLNFFGAVFEQADTRSWRTLPSQIRLVRLALPPGRHDVDVEIAWPGGSRTYDLEGIELAAGEMVFRSIHRLPAELDLGRQRGRWGAGPVIRRAQ